MHSTDKKESLPISMEKLPTTESFMDSRVPYNMENVIPSFIRILIVKGILSISDAKAIMDSGKSYLH